MMTHQEMIDVIKHHENGGKVQFLPKDENAWRNYQDGNRPAWNFSDFDYRAKPDPLVLWVEIDNLKGFVRTVEFRQFESTYGGAIKKFIEEL